MSAKVGYLLRNLSLPRRENLTASPKTPGASILASELWGVDQSPAAGLFQRPGVFHKPKAENPAP